MSLKPTMPDGVIPAIKFNYKGKQKLLGQSLSMLRFLGRVYGYYPVDPLEAWKVENLISSYYENIGKFYKASLSKIESEKI
jgi:hypothetical protein